MKLFYVSKPKYPLFLASILSSFLLIFFFLGSIRSMFVWGMRFQFYEFKNEELVALLDKGKSACFWVLLNGDI